MSAKQSRNKTSPPLDPREHGALISAVIENFATFFAPGSALVYARDTHGKPSHCNEALLAQLGITVAAHNLMPDVVLNDHSNSRLFLVQTIYGNGPVHAERRKELARLFANATQHLIYVTAFPDRAIMARHVLDIAWETEAWAANEPAHLTHFDGNRLLGPYSKTA